MQIVSVEPINAERTFVVDVAENSVRRESTPVTSHNDARVFETDLQCAKATVSCQGITAASCESVASVSFNL